MVNPHSFSRQTVGLLFLLSLLVFSSGCQSQTPTVIALPNTFTPVSTVPTETALPSTVVPPTSTALPTVAPSFTVIPTVPPTISPTVSPTIAPTVPPTSLPSPTPPNSPTATRPTPGLANPELVGMIGGGAQGGLAVSGNYAFVPVGRRLLVIDVSNSKQPRVVGQSAILSDRIVSIAVANGYAYLAASYAGVYVFNVSNPRQPVQVGIPLRVKYATQVVAANGLLYAGDSDESGGITVFRLDDPAHPAAIGAITARYGYRRIAVNGKYLYAMDDALTIFDMTDPAQPKQVSPTAGMPTGNELAASGNLVVVGFSTYSHYSTGKIILVDVSEPTKPVVTSTMDMDSPVIRVLISDNWTFVATYSGVRIINTADPKHPLEVGSYRTNGLITGIERVGDNLYLSTPVGANLHILNITHPEQPIEQGIFRTVAQANDVAVSGRYAYVTESSGALAVVDLQDPRSPVTVGSSMPFYPRAVTYSGHYVFVAHQEGMRIFDVADLTRPKEVGGVSIKGGAEDVTIVGNRAYLASGDSGLVIVNITNPSAPVVMGSSRSGYMRDAAVAVAGDYAYLASDWDVRVVKVSDPANPTEVARVPMGAGVYGVRVSGRYAYVAAGAAGLRILDLANPAQPVVVGMFGAEQATDLAIVNGLAYLGDGGNGLWVIDVTDPAHPRQVAYYGIGAYHLTVAGEYIYVIDGDAALTILWQAQMK